MRIGIDARLVHYSPGGSAEYIRHVIQELAGLDYDTKYWVIHHVRAAETLAPSSNFCRVNAYTPSHYWLERWTLSAELIRLRLDLFHSPDTIPPQAGARRKVITIHDLHYLLYPQFMTAASRRYYKDQIAWAVRAADHILVSSRATQHDLIRLLNVPEDKITVHRLGVNEAFRPLAGDIIKECRARLKLPETYILFVGTFEPRKNIPGLLDAYHRLCQEMPDTPPLVLAGRRGWLFDDIFAKAAALKLAERLIWLENVPTADLPAVYNGASVLVLPSHYEGFGLTALEAMACGTPVIATNRSSVPEVVGDAGLLIDPDDPAGIADALKHVLQDSELSARMRANGLARAATFTWRHTAEKVLQVYRDLWV